MSKETVLPKNIRQIGEIRGREKICLEDYVVTYIRKKEQQEEKGYLGIFLGEQQETEDSVYVFIRGILEVPQEEQEEDNPQEKLMEMLQREQKNYFPDWEIQGCCVIGTYPAARMEALSKLIPQAGSVLYHLQEQEETLYHMENGQYARLRGYFVFYEQNRNMQEYLADSFPEDNVEKESRPDTAIKSFREKVKEKGIQKQSSMLKLASSFFVIAVLVVGVVAVNRVEDIRAVRSLIGGSTPENEAVQEQKLVNGALMADPAQSQASGDGQNTESAVSTADTLPVGSNAFWEETFEDMQNAADSAEASGDDKTADGSVSVQAGAADASSQVSGDSISVQSGAESASAQGSESLQVSGDNTSVQSGTADASWQAGDGNGSAQSGVASASAQGNASSQASSGNVSGQAGAADASSQASGGNTSVQAGAENTSPQASGGSVSVQSGAESASAQGSESLQVSGDNTSGQAGTADSSSQANGGSTSAQPGAAGSSSAKEAASRQTQAAYIIKEGDTLADICSKYYGTLDRLAEICEANEIADANLIMPGQKIVLP